MPLGSQAGRTQEVLFFVGIIFVCYFGFTSFPLVSFSVIGSYLGYYIVFSFHVFLGFPKLQQFLSLFLSFMTLIFFFFCPYQGTCAILVP